VPLQPEELLKRELTYADTLESKREARLDLAAEVLHRFGEVRFVAHGSSMIPSIYPGDLLTVRSESVTNARSGEIVLFLLGGRFFVHRVMRKWPQRDRVLFATRGDALPQEDSPVDGSQLLGRVTAILRYGKRINPANHVRPWMRFLRWGVQNSSTFAKTLLAAHLLLARIFRSGAPETVGTPGEQLQECA
jgi:signal peptidase I